MGLGTREWDGTRTPRKVVSNPCSYFRLSRPGGLEKGSWYSALTGLGKPMEKPWFTHRTQEALSMAS